MRVRVRSAIGGTGKEVSDLEKKMGDIESWMSSEGMGKMLSLLYLRFWKKCGLGF